MSDLSDTAVNAALAEVKGKRELEQQLERALAAAVRNPLHRTEHSAYSAVVGDAADGEKVLVITTPDGQQDVYPMVRRNRARLAGELLADEANSVASPDGEG